MANIVATSTGYSGDSEKFKLLQRISNLEYELKLCKSVLESETRMVEKLGERIKQLKSQLATANRQAEFIATAESLEVARNAARVILKECEG